MSEVRQAFVGVGANLGDRWATISAALEKLRRTPGVLAVEPSPVFESEPVGILDQPPFLNLVAGLETTLSPEALLRRLLEIERALGRERLVRWGPRTIDLDLLAYEDETRATPELELPHPRLWERTFVVEPLRALLARPRFAAPRWAELRARLPALPDERGLRRWAPPGAESANSETGE
ncbi:MAG: 2-amino-4-hydroxy-6-hydroxymethyldihydropteridine diphosphokinase [Opitutae bacterium]|nr:2-amino-4-hydroxy-6-hydroxymethyldihydropteridine diphosphokinase [Opitutae bacterium]